MGSKNSLKNPYDLNEVAKITMRCWRCSGEGTIPPPPMDPYDMSTYDRSTRICPVCDGKKK